MKRILSNLESRLYIYRYDIFAISIMLICIMAYFEVLFQPGQIVFSDIDFPFYSEKYLEEIYGLWHGKWNTTSMLNIPRLFMVLPSFLLSRLFDYDGSVFLKSFIFQQCIISAFSLYLLGKRLISVYYNKEYDLWRILSLIFGSLLYALNPYFIFRIQHIYLLVGYSVFPLIILFFFKIFDHKFQNLVIKDYNPYETKLYYENYRDAFILAFLIAMGSAAIHYFFYSFMALGIILILIIIKYMFFLDKTMRLYRMNMLKVILKKIVVIAIPFIGFSLFWLSIYLGSILVGAEASQHNINVIDTFTMFSRESNIINVIFLNSYWWKMIPEASFGLSFYIGGVILLLIITIGIVYHFFRHHIITLVVILGALMLLLATGVQYPVITNLFLRLCNLPFFGNVFRDPNKLIGLLALSYAVLMIFGVETVVIYLEKLKKRWLIPVLFSVVSLGMMMYLMPMKIHYVDHYYHPVVEPEDYVELREEYAGSDRYAVYLPTAEQMLRPLKGIATPRWNTSEVDKATGDVHIYNSPINTLFHHEGNDPTITHYMNFMQHLLDTGRTTQLSNYLNRLGADTFIYHNEYMDMIERQAFNEVLLDYQGLNPVEDKGIFNIFDVPKTETNNDLIYTPYGLYQLETLLQLESDVIFTNQKLPPVIDHVRSTDMMVIHDDMDMLLSQVDEKYKLFPFQWVSELNPFIKWSKTYLKNPEWAWFLNQLDRHQRAFDFDQDHGIAVTFASGKLDIQPHLRNHLEGELVIDFDTMIRTETFFEADTPTLYEVNANPLQTLDDVGIVRGVISQGDPNDIWQVAKSKLIRASENTPYGYNVVVSGRHVSKLHMKVRFFNSNREEIGVEYVVAPNEVIDFEAVNFVGEAVSPKDTMYMRLDLLSFQRPEVKTYWWIHDVNIVDYSDFKAENIIEGQYNAEGTGLYRIYMKSFASPKGGELELKINDMIYQIDTIDELYGFKWIDVGEVSLLKGHQSIALQNIDGFNAVNQIVIVPEDTNSFDPIMKKMVESRQVIALEGEKDFYFDGNIQSRRSSNIYTYGQGLSLSEGEAYRTIDIIEDGMYAFYPRIIYKNESSKEVKMIISRNGETVFEKAIPKEHPVKEVFTINYTPLSKDYLYQWIERDKTSYYYNGSITVPLSKGTYEIRFVMDSNVVNLSPMEDLYKFDGSELIVSNFLEDPYYTECSPCESITMDMFDRVIEDGLFTAKYDPTCSCDWYIYSSPKIPINPYDELRVAFEARSEFIDKRHGKLVYVDAFDHVLDTQFIFEVEEDKKLNWNKYEQLALVPEGTHAVYLQFWTRGHKKVEGMLELKNVTLELYDDYTTLDHLIILEEGRSNETVIEHSVTQLSEMTVDITSSRSGLYNSMISPSNLWRVGGKKYDLLLNGVTMGYFLDKGTSRIETVLKGIYTLGIRVYIITLVGGMIILMIMGKRGRNEKDINH